ncbi:FMN-binding protein [Candidatus Laterigemmans baculatus]|uniref:FMN-binding protein n=1 Tax=Candidatus Laterigemmans baculatus TaxID=2770505 RepID=UPI0013DA5A41|nr:FMN-binding protein [Candidatus Laterigemmans baculatus]
MRHLITHGVLKAVWAVGWVCLTVLTGDADAQDEVEFISGSKLQGKVTAIRKNDKEFDFSAKIGERVTTRTYPFDRVHAVTLSGKRHVLTPLPSAQPTPQKSSTESIQTSPRTRSPAEINRLIEQAGQTPPEWYDSVALEYPDTLDLDWPLKPPGEGWNNQKNMGQYIWDVINPNPHRWQSGIKLVHYCMTLHADQPALLERDMRTLGTMYFQLLQDYPRAAFWLRKSAGSATPRDRVLLGECYWRLGNRAMAMEMLRSKQLPIQAIKLFGDLGETQRAVQLATAASTTSQAAEAFLLAGDALRQAGQPQKAIEFYQRVLSSKNHRNEDYAARYAARARESIEAVKLFDQFEVSKTPSGTYTGVSTGYNGPMTIAVEVQEGRIASVKVTNHQEKQFYSALEDTPRRIIDRQHLDVDAVSGATITSQAIVNATARAWAAGNE